MKARKMHFCKTNTNCLVRFDSNVNGLFGQVLSILCVYVGLQWCYTEDQNHEPCWQPAVSAARNKTRNKCFMKQTYTSLPYFLVTSLLPAAASKHLGFSTFCLNSLNTFFFRCHIVISNLKISHLPSHCCQYKSIWKTMSTKAKNK